MNITLTATELQDLTGYKRPGDQLRELIRRGFFRARRSAVTGCVILERAHYDAVCSGGMGSPEVIRPRLRPPTLKAVS